MTEPLEMFVILPNGRCFGVKTTEGENEEQVTDALVQFMENEAGRWQAETPLVSLPEVPSRETVLECVRRAWPDPDTLH